MPSSRGYVPERRSYGELEQFAERNFADERERRLFLARARAQRRDWAQKHGVPVEDVPAGIAFIRRPDTWLPYERDLAIARGRQLAKEHGWKDIVP